MTYLSLNYQCLMNPLKFPNSPFRLLNQTLLEIVFIRREVIGIHQIEYK